MHGVTMKEMTVLFKITAETKQTKNIADGIYHSYNDV